MKEQHEVKKEARHVLLLYYEILGGNQFSRLNVPLIDHCSSAFCLTLLIKGMEIGEKKPLFPFVKEVLHSSFLFPRGWFSDNRRPKIILKY